MSDPFDIDAELVRKLSDLLSETGLGEIEYEDGGKRIRVARPSAGSVAAPVVIPPAAEASNATTPMADAGHPGAIASPMVGTVYLSQSAMKTFNEVKAPRGGTVTEIAVTSGQPVEFGELLAIVE